MKSLLASLLLISTAYAAPVELTDVTGEFKIRCTIVRIDGDTAVLKPVDGDEIKVPLNKLSADSLIRVVKELSTRLPKPPPKLEKPMIPPAAAEQLNDKTIRELRGFNNSNEMNINLTIKPVVNIPHGSVFIELYGKKGELAKLRLLRNLKDLSEVDTLDIRLLQLSEIDRPELAGIINLFTECKRLYIHADDRRTPTSPVPKFLTGIALPKLETLRITMAFSDDVIVPLIKRSPNLKKINLDAPSYIDAVSGQIVNEEGLDSLEFLQFLPKLESLDLTQQKIPDDALAVVKQLPVFKRYINVVVRTTLQPKNASEIIQAGEEKNIRIRLFSP